MTAHEKLTSPLHIDTETFAVTNEAFVLDANDDVVARFDTLAEAEAFVRREEMRTYLERLRDAGFTIVEPGGGGFAITGVQMPRK